MADEEFSPDNVHNLHHIWEDNGELTTEPFHAIRKINFDDAIEEAEVAVKKAFHRQVAYIMHDTTMQLTSDIALSRRQDGQVGLLFYCEGIDLVRFVPLKTIFDLAAKEWEDPLNIRDDIIDVVRESFRYYESSGHD